MRSIALILSLLIAANAEAGRFTQLILDAAIATRPGPAPTPTPPSDICDNCNGTGKLGDGTVSVTCPVCNGTGKKKTAGTAGAATTPTVNTEAPPLSADQQPTPWPGVALGLSVLKPQPDEVLVDFGCGRDARWLTHAVSFYSVKKAIGVEIDPEAAESARRAVAEAGLSDRITIITGDATQEDIKADVGVAYLWPETLEKLRPKIEELKRFVTWQHAVPGLTMNRRGDVYVYTKPAPVGVQQAAPVVWEQPRTTILNYRPATSYRPTAFRGCGNASCAMCNAIRAGRWRW